ncbi:ZYRO0A01408p [Zygosaccharomyces rouxii]|uniref:ZYRO0A01408p n=1 Tax=Zygosaccharomyces rouxii (strain ATCC 2623 / CBS 732 / NBRC 1130 / NCYC 568 / NRRL Y-229) TaxID=559307 RepID=C5DP91_ZYGRC|nr:uncharacterized protein ZYRO0A01408g [Zygosaccharomyces rouxii]KAH9198978.1 hypothetical protein LQ764DRAFT_144751 [Zygosaccharomyces rouxii]CAR25502.1 ZYRO0A01408p [Zygosaccharomyces rouxii]
MSSSVIKTALVTGASSGIGYAVVKELAENGFTVYACARRLDLLEQLSRGYEANKVIPYALDISNFEEIVQLKEYLSKHLPHQRLDVLYNNAGQSCTMPAVDVTNERLNQLFQVNVIGHMNITSQLCQFLINAKGTIVFTGSLSGVSVFPFGAAYAATKAAIHQYARVLHAEMKMFDVRVINAITGGVSTDIADKSPLPKSSPFYFPEGLKALEERKLMSAKNFPMSAETYAQKLVKDILSPRDPVDVYRGTLASVVSWLMMFAPYWLVEWVTFKKFKLDSVEKALGQKRETEKQE